MASLFISTDVRLLSSESASSRYDSTPTVKYSRPASLSASMRSGYRAMRSARAYMDSFFRIFLSRRRRARRRALSTS